MRDKIRLAMVFAEGRIMNEPLVGTHGKTPGGNAQPPFAVSPPPLTLANGRSGFGPQPSLKYDSGASNGPFGFGWILSLPSIPRKTDKGLPQHHEAAEPDVFILAGAGDLVPVLVQDARGMWMSEDFETRTVGSETYGVRRCGPRIEGLFALIELWTNTEDAIDLAWRSALANRGRSSA